MTDLQINARLAHLDGWREAFPKAGLAHPDTKRGGILLPYRWVNERTHARCMDLPDYLTDVRSVIGLLEHWITLDRPSRQVLMGFYSANGEIKHWVELRGAIGGPFYGSADTLARAGCKALMQMDEASQAPTP